MRITRREIIVSIAIVCFFFTTGLFISGRIDNALLNKYQEYNTAIQIDNNAELFEYALRTNIGHAFVYGDLVVLDPISIKDIDGEYAAIKKETQKYTEHSRTVTYKDSDGHTRTKVEYYWTWDTIWTDYWNCNYIAFLGHEFKYENIPFPGYDYYTTITYLDIRYVYYIKYTEYVGTIYTNIDNHTINNTSFINNTTIEDTIKRYESGWQKIVFWIFWIALTAGAVYRFYYLENRWLE